MEVGDSKEESDAKIRVLVDVDGTLIKPRGGTKGGTELNMELILALNEAGITTITLMTKM